MPTTDTFWKLVETQSKQLSESITAARTHFILAITWSFIWAWSLCTYEFSYLDTLYRRYELFLALSHQPDQKERFLAICKGFRILPPDESRSVNGEVVQIKDEIEHCADLVKMRFEGLFRQISERKVPLPVGINLDPSDLDIIGNLGLLLILAWSYYAIRRENYAIRTLVDLRTLAQLESGVLVQMCQVF